MKLPFLKRDFDEAFETGNADDRVKLVAQMHSYLAKAMLFGAQTPEGVVSMLKWPIALVIQIEKRQRHIMDGARVVEVFNPTSARTFLRLHTGIARRDMRLLGCLLYTYLEPLAGAAAEKLTADQKGWAYHFRSFGQEKHWNTSRQDVEAYFGKMAGWTPNLQELNEWEPEKGS